MQVWDCAQRRRTWAWLAVAALAGCSGEEPDPCLSDSPPASCATTSTLVVAILSPHANDVVFGALTVEVDARSEDGIRTVEVFSLNTSLGAALSAPYRINVDTTRISDGPAVLRADATSNDGTKKSAEVTVVVDNTTAPDLQLLSPQPGRAYGGTIRLAAEATDRGGISELDFQVDGTSVGRASTPPFEVTVAAQTLGEGSHDLKVIAKDRSGQSAEATATFEVDTQGPALTFTPGPGSRVSGLTNIQVEAVDVSGIRVVSSLGHQLETSPLTFSYDFSGTREGTFTLTASAADGAIIDGREGTGNVTEASIEVNVVSPTHGPEITVERPADNAAYGGRMDLAFSVTGSFLPLEVAATLAGGPVTLNASGDAYRASIDTLVLPDGPYVLELSARDANNNLTSRQIPLLVDNTPPRIGFNPSDGATVSGRVAVAITADDASGLRQLTSRGTTIQQSPLLLTVDTSPVAAGPFTVTATASDRAIVDGLPTGNRALASVTWTAQNSGGPQLTLIAPANVTASFGGQTTVEVSAQDADGVGSVRIDVDGQTQATQAAAPYRARLDTRTLADGARQVRVVASDRGGNPATLSFTLNVDNSPPRIGFSPPDGSVITGSAQLVVSAVDQTGLRGIFSMGATSPVSPLTTTVDLSNAPDGPYTVTASAADRAIIDDRPGVGNQATARATWTVQSGAGGPSLAFVAPANPVLAYGGRTTFEVDAQDPNGVASVELRADGVLFGAPSAPPYRSVLDTRTLSDGPHRVEALAIDSTGARTLVVFNLQVDNAPPRLSATPANGTTLRGVNQVNVTAVDASDLRSISAGGQSTSSSPLVFSLDANQLPAGPYVLTAYAEDTAVVDDRAQGNRGSLELRWLIENAAPELRFMSPSDRTRAFGGTVTLEVDASDPSGGVRQVGFGVDHQSVGAVASPPYRLRLDTTPFADGDHVLEAIASDPGSNTSTLTFTLRIDNSPPVVSIAPLQGAVVRGNVGVTVTAQDAAGLRSLDSGGFSSVQSPLTYSVDTILLPNGPLTVTATAIDDAVINDVSGVGHRTVASVTWTIDNPGPVINFTRPTNANLSYGGTLDVAVDAQSAAGVARVELWLDGAMLQAFAAGPYVRSINTTALADGNHTLEARAFDSVGNQSTAPFSLKVDNTRPSVTFGPTPAPGATVGGSVGITVNATDASGIASVSCAGQNATSSPLSFNLDTLALPNGPYTLVARGIDRAVVSGGPGNAMDASLSLTIYNAQNVPPTVTFVRPLDGEGAFLRADVQVTASAPPGITSVTFYVNGVAATTDTTAPYTATLSLAGLTGTVTLRASALSKTNVEGSASIQLTMVPPPPFIVAQLIPAAGTFTAPTFDVGRIDADATPDLVFGGAALSFVPNRGDGTFGPHRTIRSPAGSAVVRIADMNGDNIQDVISRAASAVEVYLGAGDGTFQPPVSTALGTGPTAMAVGDLDGDGDRDIVIGRGTGSDFTVLRQNAGGTFTLLAPVGIVGSVTDLALADVDGDRDLDVVLGRSGAANRYVTVYRNDGSGNFPAGLDTFGFGPPERITLGDVDGDGTLDVVASIPNGPTGAILPCGSIKTALQVFRGAGTGAFVPDPPICIAETPSGVELGDVDGDGDLDLIQTSAALHGLRIWRNTLGDFTSAERYTVARGALAPKVVQLFGDASPEVLVGSPTDLGVAVVENQGAGALSAIRSFDQDRVPTAMATAELAGGGLPDLAVAFAAKTNPREAAQVAVQRGLGDSFQLEGSRTLNDKITEASTLVVGDLNGTGALDIAVGTNAAATAGAITLEVLFDGAEVAGASATQSVNKPVGVGFFQAGPGQPRLLAVIRDNGSGVPGSLLLLDAGMLEVSTLPVGDDPAGLVVGNLDGDAQGLPDIAVANRANNNITLYRSDGSGLFPASGETYNARVAVSALAIGRVTPDGVADLLGTGPQDVVLLQGDPGSRFLAPSSWTAGGAATRLVVGDFNRDGLDDAAVIRTDDRLAVLIARPAGGTYPAGGFFPPYYVSAADTLSDLAAADFDGNGWVDLAFINRASPALSLMHSAP